MSEDRLVYEFTLRKGLKFHNGDPFTAEDVVFSFKRAKGAQLQEKVKEVVIVDPHKVQFVLHEPWPDFMAFYGTLVSAAGWITPKNYFEKVGADGFKQHPIGLGPYKFVSMKPGIELVMEANEDYWRKVPSVKRLVFQSVGSDHPPRDAEARRSGCRLSAGRTARRIDQERPEAEARLLRRHRHFFSRLLRYVGPEIALADQRVRKAASLAIDRQALSDADTLGASKPNGNIVLKRFEYALPIEPDPYDPVQAKKLLAEAGYPNGFDAGDLYPVPPYFATGEAIVGYLGAVGIKTKLRTMERAAFFAALATKKLKGLCFCAAADYGNASTRMSEIVPSSGTSPMAGTPTSMNCTSGSSPKRTPRSARRCCTRSRKPCTSGRGLRRSSTISGRAGSGRASRRPR